MIPQPFDYSAPQSLQEALALVENSERKILAGGMSLIDAFGHKIGKN